MNLETEKENTVQKLKLLKEIEYRESVMRQLSFDTYRKRFFVINFIYDVLKITKPSAPFYRKSKKDGIIYTIDSDVELQKDIYTALEKSKNKLIEIYNSI